MGELNVNEITVNIEHTDLPTTKEKTTYVLDNAKLNVPEEFKQWYIDLLLKYHEVVSSSNYDLGSEPPPCRTLKFRSRSNNSEFQELRDMQFSNTLKSCWDWE